MGSRGVLYGIEDDAARRLRLAAGDDDAVIEVLEEIEEDRDEAFVAEIDRAWDAIHRALTDGALGWSNGDYPLSHAILGGRRLVEDDDYVAVLKSPDQVQDIAGAVEEIDDDGMAERYSTIVPPHYDDAYGDDDRAETVRSFRAVRELYRSAAADGRWVLFTADP